MHFIAVCCWFVVALVLLAGALLTKPLRSRIEPFLAYLKIAKREYHATESVQATQEAVGLITIAVGEIVALGAYGLQEREPKVEVVIVYILASLIPLAGLLFLIADAKEKEGKMYYSFSRSSRRLAIVFGLTAVIVVATSATLYVQKAFALPRPAILKPDHFEQYVFKNSAEEMGIKRGDVGIVVQFPIESAKMPDPVEINLAISKDYASMLRVASIDGAESIGSEIENAPTSPPPFIFGAAEGGAVRVFWHYLKPKTKYILTVRLHAGRDVVVPKIMDQIRDGKVITAAVFFPNE